MNLQERELFWQTLCSLKGENLQEEAKQPLEKIKTAKYRSKWWKVARIARIISKKSWWYSGNK